MLVNVFHYERENLERQLQYALEARSACAKELDADGVATKERKRDPVWRQWSAKCSKLSARLRAAASVVALDEELKLRKVEKQSSGDDDEVKKKGSKKGSKKGAKKGGKKDPTIETKTKTKGKKGGKKEPGKKGGKK